MRSAEVRKKKQNTETNTLDPHKMLPSNAVQESLAQRRDLPPPYPLLYDATNRNSPSVEEEDRGVSETVREKQ